MGWGRCTSHLHPRQMFSCPNPPKLPSPRWWPNTKMCSCALIIRLHCRLGASTCTVHRRASLKITFLHPVQFTQKQQDVDNRAFCLDNFHFTCLICTSKSWLPSWFPVTPSTKKRTLENILPLWGQVFGRNKTAFCFIIKSNYTEQHRVLF